jgi:lysozyme
MNSCSYSDTGFALTRSFEGEALLRADLAAAVACVRRAVSVEIIQDQFDALVDFCFNIGCGNFQSSSLLRYANHGEFESVVIQFGLWVHAGGEVAPGLVRRRAAEAALFAGHPAPRPGQNRIAAEPGSALPRSEDGQVG